MCIKGPGGHGEGAGNVCSRKWYSLTTCSGCEMLRSPKASLEQWKGTEGGREAVLCSDSCSADTTAQVGEGKERGKREVRNSGHPSWRWSVGSADAWIGGLARRQAGSRPRLHGDKSIKKKTQKTQRSCFCRRRAHTLPLAERAEVTSESKQGWLLSRTIGMRQWDRATVTPSGSPVHAAGPCVVASCHGTGANRRPWLH